MTEYALAPQSRQDIGSAHATLQLCRKRLFGRVVTKTTAPSCCQRLWLQWMKGNGTTPDESIYLEFIRSG